MLDRLASTVAIAISTSNERMARFDERLEAFGEKIERDHDQVNAELQALSRDVSRLVDTVAAAAQERQELRNATLGIANLLSSLDSDRSTILRKLSTEVDRLLES